MSWNIRKVMVQCLPADIPDKISLDVSDMTIHDSVHVEDLEAGNFEIMDDPEETIVSIVPPTIVKEPVAAEEGEEGEEGEEAPEAAPEQEEAAEPEVISEKKAEERQEGKKE